MRVPCITEPCSKVVLEVARELQREPLDALALLTVSAAAALLTRASLRRQRCALASSTLVAAAVLHQCSHGRLERQLATWRFPHASCRALGILELNHVPAFGQPVTIHSKDNQTWRQGHRQWPVCAWPTPRRCTQSPVSSGPVVLVTLDKAYVSILPLWSKAVRAANLSCAVGSLDWSDSVCHAARRVRCDCIRSARLPTVDGTDWGRGSPRRVAVRARFEVARTLLSGGGGIGSSAATEAGVLMHDADVSFDDLHAFVCFLRHQSTRRDLIVQPNGPRRKEAYEDLNFGLAWLSPSTRTRNLLDCALATWDHSAFEHQPPEAVAGGSYYERSQPRLNHLLESSLVAAVAPPRVCTLPTGLRYTHATNLASPTAKLQRLNASRSIHGQHAARSNASLRANLATPAATPLPLCSQPLPMSDTLAGSQLTRIIWLFWEPSGGANGAVHRQQVLRGWQRLNPAWDVRILDLAAAMLLAPRFNRIVATHRRTATIQLLSDVLRLELLAIYGGVWADMSLMPVQPLDAWIQHALGPMGFWSFVDERGGPPQLKQVAGGDCFGLPAATGAQKWAKGKTPPAWVYRDYHSVQSLLNWFLAVRMPGHILVERWLEELVQGVQRLRPTGNVTELPYFLAACSFVKASQREPQIRQLLATMSLPCAGASAAAVAAGRHARSIDPRLLMYKRAVIPLSEFERWLAFGERGWRSWPSQLLYPAAAAANGVVRWLRPPETFAGVVVELRVHPPLLAMLKVAHDRLPLSWPFHMFRPSTASSQPEVQAWWEQGGMAHAIQWLRTGGRAVHVHTYPDAFHAVTSRLKTRPSNTYPRMRSFWSDFFPETKVLTLQADIAFCAASPWVLSNFTHLDYIGAPWPKPHGALYVGNGGFTLRSRDAMIGCIDWAVRFRQILSTPLLSTPSRPPPCFAPAGGKRLALGPEAHP